MKRTKCCEAKKPNEVHRTEELWFRFFFCGSVLASDIILNYHLLSGGFVLCFKALIVANIDFSCKALILLRAFLTMSPKFPVGQKAKPLSQQKENEDVHRVITSTPTVWMENSCAPKVKTKLNLMRKQDSSWLIILTMYEPSTGAVKP